MNSENYENMLIMLIFKTWPNHTKLLILGSGGYFSSIFTSFQKINPDHF